MKILSLVLSCIIAATSFSQPATPILRIDDEMHSAISRRLSVDKAGKFIVTCSEDKTARLWDAVTGTYLKTFRVPADFYNDGKLYSCAISPDGSIVALGGWTGYAWDKKQSIYIINVQTGEIIQRLTGLPEIINEIEFSPDGRFMAASLGSKSGIYVYTVATMQLYKKLVEYTDRVYSVAFDNTGRMATVCHDGKIRLYNNDFSLLKEVVTTAGKQPFSISFKPNGSQVAVGYSDSPVIEVRDGYTLELTGNPDITGASINRGVYVLSFSTDGNTLIGGGLAWIKSGGETKKIIRVWEKGGTGSYKDLTVIKGSIGDIKPLPSGGFAVLTTLPELIVTGQDHALRWIRQSGNNNFATRNKSHFKLSNNGGVVGFTPLEKNPFTADIPNRLIKPEPADLEIPVATGSGITVTNWDENNFPQVNGIKVEFLQQNERSLCVDISNSGKEVVIGADYSISKTDAAGKLIWRNGEMPGATWAVNISGNEKVVVAALNDGTIRWYRMSDGKEILAFYQHADNRRWVLFTPSGYYDASPGAEGLLGWHINNGADMAPSFYPLSRFKEKYYRPDIIDALLEVYYEADAISLANSRSSKKPSESAEKDIREKLPPTVTINSPANGSTVSSETINLVYSIASPKDAPAKNIRILVNGRPIAMNRGAITTGSAQLKTVVTIPLADATITVLAENDNGTSPEANLFLKWSAPVVTKEEFVYKPKLYVLAIGVSDYNNTELKLGFAAKDAGDFSGTLAKQKGVLYADVIIRKLVNKEATKDAITDGLEWIQQQTGQKDVAMIFFAGHGINDNNGIYYMLPVGADLERIRTTCLNFEELRQTVSSIAGKVVVFIDACHSGNAMGSTRRGGTDINAVVNELSSTENGAITFTSSTGKQFSLEDPAWGNGAFTKAVMEGLSGKAALPGKNKITVKSLDAYISERVKELTKGKQHPTSVTPPNVPDFPIGISQ